MCVRQGAQQNGIDEDVDDGVGADTQGQREHSGQREARRLAHLANREVNILHYALGRRHGGAVAVGLTRLLCSAETDERLAAGFFG